MKIFLKNSIFSTNRKKITVYLFINWNLKFTSSKSYIFVKIILISSTIKCSEIANENYPLPIHDVHTRSHQKCRENHKDGHPLQPEILVQRKKHTFKSFCRKFFEKRLYQSIFNSRISKSFLLEGNCWKSSPLYKVDSEHVTHDATRTNNWTKNDATSRRPLTREILECYAALPRHGSENEGGIQWLRFNKGLNVTSRKWKR